MLNLQTANSTFDHGCQSNAMSPVLKQKSMIDWYCLVWNIQISPLTSAVAKYWPLGEYRMLWILCLCFRILCSVRNEYTLRTRMRPHSVPQTIFSLSLLHSMQQTDLIHLLKYFPLMTRNSWPCCNFQSSRTEKYKFIDWLIHSCFIWYPYSDN